MYTKDIRAHYDISLISAKDVKNAQTDWSDFPHSVTSFSFSRLNALGRNVHFKKAVSLLIDRKALSLGIPGSSPVNQLLPRVAWGTSGLPDAHNKEAARKEIGLIPKELINQSWNFVMLMGARQSTEAEFMAFELCKQFEKVGLRIARKNSTEKFISEESARQNPLFLSGMLSLNSNPLPMFSSLRAKSFDSFLNPLEDKTFEEIYEKASKATHKSERLEALRMLSVYSVENLYRVPLLERRQAIFYDNVRVKSIGKQKPFATLLLEEIVPN